MSVVGRCCRLAKEAMTKFIPEQSLELVLDSAPASKYCDCEADYLPPAKVNIVDARHLGFAAVAVPLLQRGGDTASGPRAKHQSCVRLVNAVVRSQSSDKNMRRQACQPRCVSKQVSNSKLFVFVHFTIDFQHENFEVRHGNQVPQLVRPLSPIFDGVDEQADA